MQDQSFRYPRAQPRLERLRLCSLEADEHQNAPPGEDLAADQKGVSGAIHRTLEENCHALTEELYRQLHC